MFNLVNNIVADENGAILAEYGLLAVLIAVAAVVAVTAFGLSVLGLFERFPFELFS